MSLQEINFLHRRYASLSARFRAAWAFHQFISSLNKVLLDGRQPDYPVDFQEVYSELKEVSHHLNNANPDAVRDKLDHVDEELEKLNMALLEEDTRINPKSLRKFFQRVKNADVQIFNQLIKFYLYAKEGTGWPPERVDKVDFLVTCLAQNDTSGNRDSLRETFKGFWDHLGLDSPPVDMIEEHKKEVEAIRLECEKVADLDELHSAQVVARYREFKHGLGDLFFEPRLLITLVETNLALGRRIQDLFLQEERRIFSDYQEILDLEGKAAPDDELDLEMSQFRREIERFEQDLSRDELRLQSLADIRDRVRSLRPRLGRARAAPPPASPEEGAAPVDVPADLVEEGLIDGEYSEIIAALDRSDAQATPRELIGDAALSELSLEGREVVAYRRLRSGRFDTDRDLERFILETAALRLALARVAQEIRGVLDDSVATKGDGPAFVRGRLIARLGDRFHRRFGHLTEQAILDGDLAEARVLQLLRMRLLRAYSGVWLLAYQPHYSGFVDDLS